MLMFFPHLFATDIARFTAAVTIKRMPLLAILEKNLVVAQTPLQ